MLREDGSCVVQMLPSSLFMNALSVVLPHL